ncbi:trace amine-associated receptor 4-like [Thalassophryne amazonica]|uniref:trace amine-associated receptor 4-like n=1 Tax=Thalassophryne amazonica TaxID=390379 RepID=UPI001472518B|nr:trace amine-associated receptor 4-like [Thalassophryne amazonica]
MEIQNGAALCFPKLLNTSCRKPTPSRGEIALQTLLLSISVLIMVLNLLVIISVSHFRQLHVPSNLLLLSLAVSDFLVGFVLMPIESLKETTCWFLGDLTCSLYNCISFVVTSASVGNMVLISIDRYVAVCHPLHYQTRVTVRRVSLCICVCWSCSVLYGGLIVMEDLSEPGAYSSCYGECVIVINYIQGTVDLILTFIIPVTVIVVLYMRVFVVAVSQARAMRSHVTAVTHQQSVHIRVKKSEMKAARTLGVIVFVFIITFFPYYCVTLVIENPNAQSAVFLVFCVTPI